MKYIVLTFSLIISTAACAFDISLEGVEFGKLEIGNDVFQSLGTAIPGRTILNNAEVILNDGDVLQVLRFSHWSTALYNSYFSGVGTGIRGYYFYSISENTTSYSDTVGTYIVGPCIIRLGYEKDTYTNLDTNIFSSNEEYFCLLDYAILRAGDSSQSSISYT